MHRRYGERALGLTITKKEGVVEVVEGVTLVGPRKGSFSPGIGPPKHDIFIFNM